MAPFRLVSEGAELLASVVWLPSGAGQASLVVRLSQTASGAVAVTRRGVLPMHADPVALARQAVSAIGAALGQLGRLPAWGDPIPGAAPAEFTPSSVPEAAVENFLAGLAAEESWR